MVLNATSSSTFTEVLTIVQLATITNQQYKQILAFPTALTDSECIALTTL